MAAPKLAQPKLTGEAMIITLPALTIQTAEIQLIGDSPLICHAWSKKAKQEILDKQMKKAKQAKGAKNPQTDYEESLYVMPEDSEAKYGFPAVAFKAAAVDACSHVANITKTISRGAFHIVGELVPIFGKPHMREDMVRLGGIGAPADIRFRGEFTEWSTKFTIRYNSNVIQLEQIMNLFNTAGFAIGVGEWRPQKDGVFGMFHCKHTGDLNGTSETLAEVSAAAGKSKRKARS